MEIKKVGVVGCGQMGAGIAETCAQSGYTVVVSEINEGLLNRGLSSIRSSLTKSVQAGRISKKDKEATIARIKGTTNIQDFYDCDLVIEAIVEDIESKQRVFAELDKICLSDSILASNTSCLSIISMASQTERPEKVLGLHFSNPVPVMKSLEIVRTLTTSEETVEVARKFGESIGKVGVIVSDTPGFIGNRLLIPYLLDAIRLLEANVATKEDIDTLIMLGLRHPMGPITLADLVGLDTVYFISNAMYEELKDPKFAPPTILKKMVAAGRLGRKTGKGFYQYEK